MLQLSADGLPTIDLDDLDGFTVTSVDFGQPETRAVVTPRPNKDGTTDETSFLGDRAVTITGTVSIPDTGTRQSVLDTLRLYTHPKTRPTLAVSTEAGGSVRTLSLRADTAAAPLVTPGTADVMLSWRGAPFFIGGARSVLVAPASGASAGRTYSRTYPRAYPQVPGGAGQVNAVNDGNTDAWPVIRIFGPCTGPALTLASTAQTLGFPGLTLTAADYLEIDMDAETAAVNGDPTASRLEFVDWLNSEFWSLPPGLSVVRFSAASFTGACQASLVWSDTYL